jgi:hypothetical protein
MRRDAGVVIRGNPAEETERMDLESLVRGEFERCHPGDTFEDMKRRARFSKEDKGLLRDWMAVAARRAAVRHAAEADAPRAAA